MQSDIPEVVDLTQFIIRATDADGCILLVLTSDLNGPYYSAQLSTRTPTLALQRAVDLLRDMAAEIEKGIEARQAS
jgi:hypothetical protein